MHRLCFWAVSLCLYSLMSKYVYLFQMPRMRKTRYNFSKMSFAQLNIENKLHEFLKSLKWFSKLYIFRHEFKFKRETKKIKHRFSFICFSKPKVTVYNVYIFRLSANQFTPHFQFVPSASESVRSVWKRKRKYEKPKHNLQMNFCSFSFSYNNNKNPIQFGWSICMSNEIDTIQFICNGMKFVQ